MTLQWLSAAAFLYTELAVGFLLCLGFISNARWNYLFKSRLLTLVKQYGNFYFSAFVMILFGLLIDSVYQMRRYSKIDTSQLDLRNNPQSEVQAHMKLFRAQRNCYISGFSLFMLIVIRRLVTLISRQANTDASLEAMSKQATGASEQCRKLMEENEALTRGNRRQAAADTDQEDEEKMEREKELRQLKEELAQTKIAYDLGKKDMSAMTTQVKGLHEEYDRLAEEHQTLMKKCENEQGDEKKDC